MKKSEFEKRKYNLYRLMASLEVEELTQIEDCLLYLSEYASIDNQFVFDAGLEEKIHYKLNSENWWKGKKHKQNGKLRTTKSRT